MAHEYMLDGQCLHRAKNGSIVKDLMAVAWPHSHFPHYTQAVLPPDPNNHTHSPRPQPSPWFRQQMKEAGFPEAKLNCHLAYLASCGGIRVRTSEVRRACAACPSAYALAVSCEMV